MLSTIIVVLYTIVVWIVPSVFWYFSSAWFRRTAKRFRFFIPTFNISIFVLYVLIPILVTVMVERKSLGSMGFFFPAFPNFIIFTLLPYIIILVFTLYEIKFRVVRKGEPIEKVAPLPKSYLREFLDQILCVALAEEVLIRGFLLSHLIELINVNLAIATSALIFSLTHIMSGGGYRALRTILDGVIYGFVFAQTGLYPCITVHFLGNLLTGKIARKIL